MSWIVRTSRVRLGALATAIAGLIGAGGCDGVAASDEPEPLGPGDITVHLEVEHSLFEPTEITVREGSHVTFVVDNGDPIGHELIVGDEALHAAHERGTHAEHPTVPGEVSVDPNAHATTTYHFDEPGTVEFACHLPGHYDYGMHGIIIVVGK